MLSYEHSSEFNNSIPVFQLRAIQPSMKLTKHLWECYETKCMHFIDHQFAPVKKRSWFNKHTNERVDVICEFEWTRVATLLENMREEETVKAEQLALEQEQIALEKAEEAKVA